MNNDTEVLQKPVVYFIGNPVFVYGRASVYVTNHPTSGPGPVVTSLVVEKVSDTEFHTLNTIYKQVTDVMDDLVIRLRTRAEIRRQIGSRKSVQEGKPDRIADLLDEAANEIERLQKYDPVSIQFKLANDLSIL